MRSASADTCFRDLRPLLEGFGSAAVFFGAPLFAGGVAGSDAGGGGAIAGVRCTAGGGSTGGAASWATGDMGSGATGDRGSSTTGGSAGSGAMDDTGSVRTGASGSFTTGGSGAEPPKRSPVAVAGVGLYDFMRTPTPPAAMYCRAGSFPAPFSVGAGVDCGSGPKSSDIWDGLLILENRLKNRACRKYNAD